MLNSYLASCAALLKDPSNQTYTVTLLTGYINLARQQVAMRAACVRQLLPAQSPVLTLSLTAGGSGYTVAPSITIGGTGSYASATATIATGSVSSLTLAFGGQGYIAAPTVTISGGGGSGAAATAAIGPVFLTQTNQETYPVVSISLTAYPALASIFRVRGISVNQGGLKNWLNYKAWPQFDAILRAYQPIYIGPPYWWTMYGSGSGGVIYMNPIPQQAYPADVDAICMPIPLVNDATLEAIPSPWDVAVPYYAAHLAYLGNQRAADAKVMLDLFDLNMRVARQSTRGSDIPTMYGA